MQGTRTPSSTGFRRRCAAWRVTLERPKVTKGLIPHLFALLRRVPSVQAKGLAERRRRYIPVPPASAPSSMTALLTLCPHLGEQQGATANPQHRGRLTGVGCNKRSALHCTAVTIHRPLAGEVHGAIRKACNQTYVE